MCITITVKKTRSVTAEEIWHWNEQQDILSIEQFDINPNTVTFYPSYPTWLNTTMADQLENSFDAYMMSLPNL